MAGILAGVPIDRSCGQGPRTQTGGQSSYREEESQPNLLAWLAAHKELTASGPLCCSKPRINKVRERAGIRWQKDILRHTYGSYHLAKFKQEGLTALQMGNSVQVVFKHYRGPEAEMDDVDAFWDVMPEITAPPKQRMAPVVRRKDRRRTGL